MDSGRPCFSGDHLLNPYLMSVYSVLGTQKIYSPQHPWMRPQEPQRSLFADHGPDPKKVPRFSMSEVPSQRGSSRFSSYGLNVSPQNFYVEALIPL